MPRIVRSSSPFFLARFCSMLGDQFVTFTVPVAVYLASGSIEYSGVAYFIEWLPRTISLPILGIIVDRFSIARQMYFVDLARAIVACFMCLFPSMGVLMGLAGIVAVLNAHAFLLTDKILASEMHGGTLGGHQARAQMLVQCAKIVGPAGAGTLLAVAGSTSTLIMAALLFTMSFVVNTTNLARVWRDDPSAPSGAFTTLVHTARLLYSLAPLRRLLGLTFLVNLAEGICGALLPAMVLHELEGDSQSLGWITSSAAFGSVALLFLLVRVSQFEDVRKLGLVSMLTMFASGFIAALTGSILCFSLAFVVFTVARNGLSVCLRTTRLALIPHEWVGRALGLLVSCDLLAFPVAGALVAVLGDKVSPHRLMLVVLVCTLCSASLAFRQVFRYNLPDPGSPKSAL